MSDLNIIIGKNLMALRKKKGLTQLQLAEQFNYSDKSISKWEKGEAMPAIDILKNLADFYGVTLDFLTEEEIEFGRTNLTDKTKAFIEFLQNKIKVLENVSNKKDIKHIELN